MKKISLLFWMLLAFTSVQAQDFKPFKLGFGFGYAKPIEGGGGLLASLEPAYRINDAIAVGLRLELAGMGKVVGRLSSKGTLTGCYSVNGQYYFGKSKFRPYAGLGLGLYSMGSLSLSQSINASIGEKFGFYPRVGIDFGHLNFNIDYNIIAKSSVNSISLDNLTSLQTEKVDVKNSYIGFRIGFFLFGGKNKN